MSIILRMGIEHFGGGLICLMKFEEFMLEALEVRRSPRSDLLVNYCIFPANYQGKKDLILICTFVGLLN
jgi:hypothetical protein